MSKKKLDNYDYTVYTLKESLKCELEELDSDWLTKPSSAYTRGKLNAYKEMLFFLTLDEKWNLTLEELQSIILNEE